MNSAGLGGKQAPFGINGAPAFPSMGQFCMVGEPTLSEVLCETGDPTLPSEVLFDTGDTKLPPMGPFGIIGVPRLPSMALCIIG